MFIKQDSTTLAAVQEEVFKGTSLWDERAEEQDVQTEDPRVANKQTFSVANFDKGIDVSKNFFDDNLFSVYNRSIADMGRKANITQNNIGYGIYRNSFTTTLTASGATLVSDTHTTIGGATVDNKITAALSEASLNTAIIALAEQKDQAGVVVGGTPAGLLVPPALFKKTAEILDSELRSGTANNDTNVYLTKYGIAIGTNNQLGAVITGGSDKAWWLVGDNHAVRRWVRQGIETVLVDWRFQRNNNYIYKGEYREVYGAIDYVGLIGSPGTT